MTACAVPNCFKGRAPSSKYCRPHARRLNSYGSPTGRPIPRRWLYHHAARAKAVLEANSGHPGLHQATDELARLLGSSRAQAVSGRIEPGSMHLARLAAEGISPVTILAMVAGVALYDRENERALRSRKEYVHAIGRAVAGLIPRRRLASRSRAVTALGSLMVDRYAPLLAGVVKAVADVDEASRQRAVALSAPLKTP